jgi:uroporphyrinogen-III synthase
MARPSRPTVALLSAEGTLPGVDALLRREGVRPLRLVSVVPRPVAPDRWAKRLHRWGTPDTVVVTSRAAVFAGVLPWRRRTGRTTVRPEYWAAGPGTADALRRAGVRPVRRPRGMGATAVAEALRRTSPRSIVYFRSNAAGPGLARTLRSQGHRIADLVVYRLVPPPPLSASARRELATTTVLVATSPSALSALRRRLDAPTFARLRRSTNLVVLGDRSRRAARGHGFRHVSVAPSTTPQRFTRHLLRELRDARP